MGDRILINGGEIIWRGKVQCEDGRVLDAEVNLSRAMALTQFGVRLGDTMAGAVDVALKHGLADGRCITPLVRSSEGESAKTLIREFPTDFPAGAR